MEKLEEKQARERIKEIVKLAFEDAQKHIKTMFPIASMHNSTMRNRIKERTDESFVVADKLLQMDDGDDDDSFEEDYDEEG